jgi:hypothetical protein
LGGPLVTRQTGNHEHPVAFLGISDAVYISAFSAVALVVGGYRLMQEWREPRWHWFFCSWDTMAFLAAIILMGLAFRDLQRLNSPPKSALQDRKNLSSHG